MAAEGGAPALPDRTPPSTRARYPSKRTPQTCEVCGGAYLIAPTVAHLYHTCSAACSTQLRSRQRRGRQGPARRGAAQSALPAYHQPPPQERSDLHFLPRGGVLVSCIRCGGRRGRWRRHELPPPELCWRCVMRRNAGLDDGISRSRGV